MLLRQIESARSQAHEGQESVRKEVGDLARRVKDEVGGLQQRVATELKGVSVEVSRQLQEGMRLIQSAQATMGDRLAELPEAPLHLPDDPREARRGDPAGRRGRQGDPGP